MLAYTWESDFSESSANLQVLHLIQSTRSQPISEELQEKNVLCLSLKPFDFGLRKLRLESWLFMGKGVSCLKLEKGLVQFRKGINSLASISFSFPSCSQHFHNSGGRRHSIFFFPLLVLTLWEEEVEKSRIKGDTTHKEMKIFFPFLMILFLSFHTKE